MSASPERLYYKVVRKPSIAELEEEVEEYLLKGWRLRGELVHVPFHREAWTQVVVGNE